MSRLQHHGPTSYRDLGPLRGPRAYDAASKKHKVVFEQVTQEKKKLRSVLTFKAEAPPGYTFVQAGDPRVTTLLKDAAREANVQIFAVSTTPHANVHDLSQQVHRVGFHFPNSIVDHICMSYGIRIAPNGTVVVPSSQVPLPTNFRTRKRDAHTPEKDQVTINTEAREIIKDLFPNIPDNDLYTIIKTAFRKGKNRVGTANELPLIRRAQLAVVAHIRHVYTPYDKLLRNGTYHEARSKVEKATLEHLVAWRGDDEGGTRKLEDVLREVVVISDDEESDEGDDDSSVEVISSGDDSQRRVQTRPVAADQIHLLDDNDHLHREDRSPVRARIISAPRRNRHPASFERYDRYRGIWSDAVQNFKLDPTQHTRSFGGLSESKVHERSPPRFLNDRTQTEVSRQDQIPLSRMNDRHLSPISASTGAVQIIPRRDGDQRYREAPQASHSDYSKSLRGPDSTLYDPMTLNHSYPVDQGPRRYSSPPTRFVKHTFRSPPRTLTSNPSQCYPSQGSRFVRLDPAEVAIPSIEIDNMPSHPVKRSVVGNNELHGTAIAVEPRRPMLSSAYPVNDLSKDVEVIRLTSDRPSNRAKRGLTEAFPEEVRHSERQNKVSRYAAFANHNRTSVQPSDSSIIDLTSPPRRRYLEGRLAAEPDGSNIRGHQTPPRSVQAIPTHGNSPASPNFPSGARKSHPMFVDGPSDTILCRRPELSSVENEPLPLRRYTEYRSREHAEPVRLRTRPQEPAISTTSRQSNDYATRQRPSSSMVPARDEFDRRYIQANAPQYVVLPRQSSFRDDRPRNPPLPDTSVRQPSSRAYLVEGPPPQQYTMREPMFREHPARELPPREFYSKDPITVYRSDVTRND